MALYDFKNRKTGKIKEYDMKMAEYDDFVKAHPELERIYTPTGFADPLSLGRLKPPADFQKGILDRIKHSVPGAAPGMNRTRWPNIKEL